MFLKISNLTTIWKKSLRRYVSVYTFMSYGLISKTIITMFFYNLIQLLSHFRLYMTGPSKVLTVRYTDVFDILQRFLKVFSNSTKYDY